MTAASQHDAIAPRLPLDVRAVAGRNACRHTATRKSPVTPAPTNAASPSSSDSTKGLLPGCAAASPSTTTRRDASVGGVA